ncbi:hypothetical protein HAX54_031974 [Datura stramonium]|uniref:Uncharacterized protein n=1 Tax=Datura stramonium TaxID=4076 RepID=A0ABS8VBB1_DATST|nr:hypothetical protein [Datura stramonium]
MFKHNLEKEYSPSNYSRERLRLYVVEKGDSLLSSVSYVANIGRNACRNTSLESIVLNINNLQPRQVANAIRDATMEVVVREIDHTEKGQN